MVTSTDVVNQAIQYIGDNQPPVTGTAPTFDSSPAGVAASFLYTPCVRKVMRQYGWDFARNTVALTLSGNPAPFPWTYEYVYPQFGVQVRQLLPPVLNDPNDPAPLDWVVANAVVNSNQSRVIQTNVANASAVMTNQPNENTWDDGFREAVVRLLASELAMAIAGRPATAQTLTEGFGAFSQDAESRDS